jgi:hypothetical protein
VLKDLLEHKVLKDLKELMVTSVVLRLIIRLALTSMTLIQVKVV